MKKRVGIYLGRNEEKIVGYLCEKYNVKPSYICALALRLCDKSEIEKILKLEAEL